MVSYVLFDLDGTLTDPAIGITNAVMYALRHYGIAVADRSTLYPFIGPPLTDSFEKYFGFSKESSIFSRRCRICTVIVLLLLLKYSSPHIS